MEDQKFQNIQILLLTLLLIIVSIYLQSIVMNKINQDIQDRAKALASQCNLAQQTYMRALALTQAASQQKSSAQAILKNDLSNIRQSLSAKVTLVNQIYEHYQSELNSLERGRKYQPAVSTHPLLQQISQFSLEMNNLLKFESLSKKKTKMEAEYLAACNKLKDQVKKVKLKISLTELEINEAQKKSAKKSVKF